MMTRQAGGGGGGQGRSGSRQGGGRGRSGRQGMGPGGKCICPNCGKQVAHRRGMPCFEVKCPDCGTAMTRQ